MYMLMTVKIEVLFHPLLLSQFEFLVHYILLFNSFWSKKFKEHVLFSKFEVVIFIS